MRTKETHTLKIRKRHSKFSRKYERKGLENLTHIGLIENITEGNSVTDLISLTKRDCKKTNIA